MLQTGTQTFIQQDFVRPDQHSLLPRVQRATPLRPSTGDGAWHGRPATRPAIHAPGPRAPSAVFVDLRRKADRGLTTLLCERARHLDRGERTLVESVFRDGRSLLDIARLRASTDGAAGRTDGPEVRVAARRLARLLKAIVRRLVSPLFVFVASALDRAEVRGDSPAWPPERRQIATLVVLRGVSVRRAARRLGIGLHAARAHARAVEAMYTGALS